jgi:hypothetical protein
MTITAVASAADGPPYLLHEGTWVCASAAAYDQALAEQPKTSGYKELMALKDRLLEAKLCMYVDDNDIRDMAPFVEILERNSGSATAYPSASSSAKAGASWPVS